MTKRREEWREEYMELSFTLVGNGRLQSYKYMKNKEYKHLFKKSK